MANIWQHACAASRIPEGEPFGVKLGNQCVALYRVNDEIFATDNICSHAFALLSDGFLEGHVIECPLHGGMFNVRSGRCEAGGYNDIRTFEVDLRDGEVYVNLEIGEPDIVSGDDHIRTRGG